MVSKYGVDDLSLPGLRASSDRGKPKKSELKRRVKRQRYREVAQRKRGGRAGHPWNLPTSKRIARSVERALQLGNLPCLRGALRCWVLDEVLVRARLARGQKKRGELSLIPDFRLASKGPTATFEQWLVLV